MKHRWALVAMAGVLAQAPVADAGVSVGIAVSLDDRNDRQGYDSGYGYGTDARRQAWRSGYDRGFREGLALGSSDGRRHRNFNYWHSSGYRNADDGYRRHLGPKPHYESGFRQGYEAGYRRGYGRYDAGRQRGYDGRYGDRDGGVIYEEPQRRW